MHAEPNLARALDLVTEMLAIPGTSGQEGQIADFIRKRLEAVGIGSEFVTIDDATSRTRILGEVGNLVVKLPGTIRAPRRLLTAHLDTGRDSIDCSPMRRGAFLDATRPYNCLGADNRAGCAVILNALIEIRERRLRHPPLTVCWFVQAEAGSQGSRHLNCRLLGRPKLAFSWDGGCATQLAVGAPGALCVYVEVSGLASDAGQAPERGISAIAIASLAIADLHRRRWLGTVAQGAHLATTNVYAFLESSERDTVSDQVFVHLQVRSHSASFRRRIVQEIRTAFTHAARQVRNVSGESGSVQVDAMLDEESFRLAGRTPCILVAEQAVRAIGQSPCRVISNGRLDASWLFHHGLSAVTLGCGQVNPHMRSERLDIAEFESACRIALLLATASESTFSPNPNNRR